MHQTILEARVAARNKVNAEINFLLPLYQKALLPFVGQKILLKTGDLSAKVLAAIQAVVPTNQNQNIQRWREPSQYALRYGIRGHEDSLNRRGSISCQCGFGVGDLRDGVLTKLYDLTEPRKTDYDAAIVEAARKEYQKAQDAADLLKGECYPFEENDNGY